jgi:hypothetical protein
MSGQQRTVDHRGGLSTELAFLLVIALRHSSGVVVVVRDRIELSTFRFRGSIILRALTWKRLKQHSSRASTLLPG